MAKERLADKAPKNTVVKAGLLKTSVTVPDLATEFTTSSILVADKVNILTAPLTMDEARERPFAFGTQELEPAADMDFTKAEELSIFFQVYNPGLNAGGKPDLTLEYNFLRKEGGGREVLQQDQPAGRQREQPAAAVRPGQVPRARRHHGAAQELRRGRIPARNQDHRQDVEQGADAERQVQRQGVSKSFGSTCPLRVRRAKRARLEETELPMIASRVWLLSATAVALALPATSAHAQAPPVSDSRSGACVWPRRRSARSTARSSTRPARRSTAPSSRRSAAPPPSPSPIGPASTASPTCPPGRTWCARTATASPAPAAPSSTCVRPPGRPRRSRCAAVDDTPGRARRRRRRCPPTPPPRRATKARSPGACAA